jgi:hypothetical protein
MTQLLCDLFYYDGKVNYTDDMLQEMWKADSDRFLRTLFHLRRHTSIVSKDESQRIIVGRGERGIFYKIIKWMSYHKLPELVSILHLIPDCGYWKDLLVLAGTPAEKAVIELLCSQLLRDYENFITPGSLPISMVSKWIPNENSSYDKRYNLYGKIASHIGITHKTLRKQYLVPMRKYLGVIEQLITEKKWEAISYRRVPKKSLQINGKIFSENDNERYEDYMNRFVRTSHVKHLAVPILVSRIMEGDEFDNKIIESCDSIVFAMDTTGAMTGFPATLAKSLLIEIGTNHWIPYDYDGLSSIETAHVITGNSDIKRYLELDNIPNKKYNLLACMRETQRLSKSHLIIVSNSLVEPEDFDFPRAFHVTYWAITRKAPSIVDYDKLTLIEGYDVNIYDELCKNHLCTREGFRTAIINSLPNIN